MKPHSPPPTAESGTPAVQRRWWPHPFTSALLVLAWLLLNATLDPAHVLLALLAGWCIPWSMQGFLRMPASTLSTVVPLDWRPVPALVLVVLHDIIQSNFTVARQALGRMDALQPAWLVLPLRLQHPHATALYATIISNTPGTISCHIDQARGLLLIHALHCPDAASTMANMQSRYEDPLLRIFERRSAPLCLHLPPP